jgi:transposase
MARYKPYDVKQITLVSVSFQDQILPGSFEYALNEIVDQHIDMKPFEARYHNDETGCLAYDPAILLKIVLFGYYKGIISSRRLAEACERNVQFKALTADTQPHFTTIADFVSSLDKQIVGVFRDVLVYADALGLIGKQTFAIDGCKLPSNASKEWSGTHEELLHKQRKYQRAARKIVERHRSRDAKEKLSPMEEQDDKKLVTFKHKISKIKEFLKSHSKNIGPSGNERKSNVTDPDSAKMSTNHGVIQGYNGIAVVDEKQQIIVFAQAHGEGQESHLLDSTIKGTREQCPGATISPDIFKQVQVVTDAGYHSNASVSSMEEQGIDAYMADRSYRQRDPAFSDYGRYKERHRQEDRRRHTRTRPDRFTRRDFFYDQANRSCRCPAGQRLYRNGSNIDVHGFIGMKFRGAKSVCGPCPLRARCLTTPETTQTKQVTIFIGRRETKKDTPIERMKRKFDTLYGRFVYNKRIAIVEPVFGNLRNKGMDRFTLRGKNKVNTQWRLFSLVHNIEKLAPQWAV